MKRNFLFIFLTVLLSLLITAVAAMVTLYGAQSQSTAETLKSDTAIYADLVKNEGYEVLDSIKSFGKPLSLMECFTTRWRLTWAEKLSLFALPRLSAKRPNT